MDNKHAKYLTALLSDGIITEEMFKVAMRNVRFVKKVKKEEFYIPENEDTSLFNLLFRLNICLNRIIPG